MTEELEPVFHWYGNSTNLCYEQEGSGSWCGLKDECQQKGLILPIFLEVTWPKGLRAFLYFFGLLYSFLGISIVSDIFMCAIEKITSKTKKIHIAGGNGKEEGPETIEVAVWNGTVANLTLMALGSSAPEILLSIIEVVFNDFEAGELGPGTIVGSAAFNLLGISAVCIMGVPNGETRRIDQIVVFAVTATFSVFAYIWLLVVLQWCTPEIVDVWEAVLTLAFFPILVLVAYSADKRWLHYLWCKGGEKGKEEGDKKRQIELGNFQPDEGMLDGKIYFSNGQLDKDSLVSFIKDVKKNTKLSDEDAAILAASKIIDSKPHSRMWYRIGAVRNITGGRKTTASSKMNENLKKLQDSMVFDNNTHLNPMAKLFPQHSASVNCSEQQQLHRVSPNGLSGMLSPVAEDGRKDFSEVNNIMQMVYEAINDHNELPVVRFPDDDSEADKAIIEFHASSAAVLENVGTYKILLIRHGKLDETVRVRVETIDGSAVENEDYEPINELLTFEPNEKEKEIGLTIVDDNQWEPDEEFFVKLTLIPEESQNVRLGRTSIMEITILNDDEPGTLQFEKRGHLVKESCGDAELSVIRSNGADGDISIKWRTIDKAAINGKDYKGGEGVLEFKHGETHRKIDIPIVNDMEFEKDENFEVELFDPSGGAKLGKISRTAVTITNDDEFNSIMNRLMVMTNTNVDGMRVSNETWAQQLKDAMNVNGGDVENATAGDYVMHFLTFGFKLIFALIPPAGIGGGWPCFVVSIAMIGILTAIVGDLASIFGCLVGLKDTVTAITFVALGTSLPDTFASKAAAVGEKNADNAIGNVTGSNSVNVFLGLGLPWVIASIYHAAKGGVFRVPAGSLGFSVTIYTTCAIMGIALLMLRRFLAVFGKAELGGPNVPKYCSAAFMITLWFLYILLSSLQAYGHIDAPF